MAILRFFALLVVLVPCIKVSAQPALRQTLRDIAESITGDVGIALHLIERGDTLSYHGTHPYPMQSVYKFQLALQVMNDVDNGKISLDQHLPVPKDEFYHNTHSPLMKEFPDGDANLPIREVLRYMIEWSDNVACDVLFKQVGGPKRVDQFVHGQGIRDMAILNTEREMHANDQLQFQNWSTPQAMAQLLVKFYSTSMLSAKTKDELWKMMVNCKTGPKRIRGLLPAGTVVANRSGTGNRTKERRITAVNDVGIIELPNGEHMAIVVFVSNSREDFPEIEEVIAKVAKEAFDHFDKR